MALKFLHDEKKRTFILLWLCCIIGTWAVLPYTYYLGMVPISPETYTISTIILSGTIQAAVFYAVVCWISAILLKKVDFNPFDRKDFVKRSLYPALIGGVVVGILIVICDWSIFQSAQLSVGHPPRWAGALASIYGAINEEVLCRLFLLTMIIFVLNKIIKSHVHYRTHILWASILITAAVFGAGHYLSAIKLGPLPDFGLLRILVLNGIAGVVFGWLYCRRGLWSAIIAHFCADLIIHVLLI